MPTLRSVLISALAGAALLAPAVPAQAQTRPEAQVNSFLRDYRHAILHQVQTTPRQVRAKYLTPGLNRRLDTWAKLHHGDPVFRAQNVPTSWTTRYEGSSTGHSTVVLTERWGNGVTQDVWYSVQLADMAISDVEEPPR